MFSVVSGLIGLAAALSIVILIRKDQLHVRYGIWWIVVALAFVVLGFFPGLFDKLASWLGIAYGPVLALTLGLTIFVIKLLTVDIARSRNEAKLVRLTQRMAILESEINQMSSGNDDINQADTAEPDAIEKSPSL